MSGEGRYTYRLEGKGEGMRVGFKVDRERRESKKGEPVERVPDYY